MDHTNAKQDDPLLLVQWPQFVWTRCFTFNMPLPSAITLNPTSTIVYLMQSCLRIEDNLTFLASRWLSTKLGIPLVVATLVETAPFKIFNEMQSEILPVAAKALICQHIDRATCFYSVYEELTEKEIPFVGIPIDTLEDSSLEVRVKTISSYFLSSKDQFDASIFVFFTDDFLHPINFHLCSTMGKSKNIPILAFDSNNIIPNIDLGCDSIDIFESRFLDSMKEHAFSVWSSEFSVEQSVGSIVQQRLKFNKRGDQFIPSVINMDVDPNTNVVDWNKFRISLMQLQDRLNICSVMWNEVMESALSSTETPMAFDHVNVLLKASKIGILSPIRWCKAHAKCPSRFELVANIWMKEQYACYRMTRKYSLLLPVTVGLLDWLGAIDDCAQQVLLDSAGSFAIFQQKIHALYGSTTPRDVRCCKTPIKCFNILNWKLVNDKVQFWTSPFYLACWILCYIGLVPNVQVALQLSFRDLVIHSWVPIETCAADAALFVLAAESIVNECKGVDNSQRGAIKLYQKFEEWRRMIENETSALLGAT